MVKTLREALLESAYKHIGYPNWFIQSGVKDDLLSAYQCVLTLDSDRINRDPNELISLSHVMLSSREDLQVLLLRYFIKHAEVLTGEPLISLCCYISCITWDALKDEHAMKTIVLPHRNGIKLLCSRAIAESSSRIHTMIDIIGGSPSAFNDVIYFLDKNCRMMLELAILFDRYDLFGAFSERIARNYSWDEQNIAIPCFTRMSQCRTAARCIQIRWRKYCDRKMRMWIARACHAKRLPIGYVIYSHIRQF